MANFKIEYQKVIDGKPVQFYNPKGKKVTIDDFTISGVYPETAAWITNPPPEAGEDWPNNWALERLAKRNRASVAGMKKAGFEIVSIKEVEGRRLKINRRKR